ncbi:MAG: hypothetical protein GC202_12745 [Alphaproteobacteria bacterium]|nr:hypothetical protein [Alphaproteobacteria bacterium]
MAYAGRIPEGAGLPKRAADRSSHALRRRRFILLATAGTLADAVVPAFAAKPPPDQPVRREIAHGQYFEYVPQGAITGVLVLAHGSVEDERREHTTDEIALAFARRWTGFADSHGLIVLAPVFGAAFGSWIGDPSVALGGYRALEGRDIGADDFVDRIVDLYAARAGSSTFILYGHSAGGQFANRYAVRHAGRLKALILSAPGRYAFPDPTAPWPYGQKPVSARAKRGGTARLVTPDPAGWAQAAALPISVVVGGADTEPQPPREDHPGSTRIDYARAWVGAMGRLAPAGQARIRLTVVPGVGHNSARLTPTCQKELAEIL